uniref:Uncharacterized protein n=1 Tax=Setaria viridis TaxID=4556 RepID=A0A4U6VPC0_SETVI|nr:hypothetical protein SEVIR_2G058532v2 [Setaria viridis]
MMTETANDQIMLRSFICSWMHGRYILRRFARVIHKFVAAYDSFVLFRSFLEVHGCR